MDQQLIHSMTVGDSQSSRCILFTTKALAVSRAKTAKVIRDMVMVEVKMAKVRRGRAWLDSLTGNGKSVDMIEISYPAL